MRSKKTLIVRAGVYQWGKTFLNRREYGFGENYKEENTSRKGSEKKGCRETRTYPR